MENTRDKANLARIQIFIRHAQRFGTSEVMSAAIERGCDIAQLELLLTKLDEIDEQNAKKARFGTYKKPRISTAIRVRRLLGLEDEEEKED